MKYRTHALFSLILFLAACSPSPDAIHATETAFVGKVIAQITASAPVATVTGIPTATPQPSPTTMPTLTPPTITPKPTVLPTPTHIPEPTLTPIPDPIFKDFGSLCTYIKPMSEIEQDAFSQKNKGKVVGPWRGR